MRKGIKRDRTVRKGIDYEKLIKIWRVLEANESLYVAQISRMTQIPEPTVRYYLDRYLDKAVINTRISPTVKLRLVKLKPGMRIEDYLKALELIQSRKSQ
jgi:predicted transcriptional regulator